MNFLRDFLQQYLPLVGFHIDGGIACQACSRGGCGLRDGNSCSTVGLQRKGMAARQTPTCRFFVHGGARRANLQIEGRAALAAEFRLRSAFGSAK